MQGTIRKASRRICLWAVVVATGAAGTASASIVMNGTRYVYGKR